MYLVIICLTIFDQTARLYKPSLVICLTISLSSYCQCACMDILCMFLDDYYKERFGQK